MLSKSKKAINDLDEIWLRIAVENVYAADELINRVENVLFMLADNPYAGRVFIHKNSSFKNWRIFPIRGYIVFYRPIENGAYIERIIHGAMDFDEGLENF